MWFDSSLIGLLFIKTVQAAPHNPECKASRPDAKAAGGSLDPTTNAGDSSPSNSICQSQCMLHLPRISAISWVPEEQIVYTSFVTAGIISEIVYMDPTLGATAVRTHIDYRWSRGSEYMYPPLPTTDDYGTSFAMTAFAKSGTTTVIHLVYPHPFIDSTTDNSWEEVSSTSNNPNAIYATAIAAPSTSHVLNHTMYLQPTAAAKNGSVPFIKRYLPLWVPILSTHEEVFFQTAFPSEKAIRHCTPIATITPTPTVFSIPAFFWDYTTITISDNPATSCNQPLMTVGNLTAQTGGFVHSDGLRGAPFQNFSTHRCEDASILTLLVHGGGTTTLYGDGPHRQTQTRPPVTRVQDRPHRENTRSSWNSSTTFSNEAADRVGPQIPRLTWTQDTNFLPGMPKYVFTAVVTHPTYTAGIAPPLQSMPGWGDTLVMPSQSLEFNADWDFQRKSAASGQPNIVSKAEQFREPDATEAALIASYFNRLPHDRVNPALFPQRTQSPNELGPGLDPINPNVVASYFKEHPEAPAKPVSGGGMLIAPLVGSKHASIAIDREAVYVTVSFLPGSRASATQKLIVTSIPTTINGISTTVPAYIIPNAPTFRFAQEITIDESPTSLSVLEVLPMYISTIVNGMTTSTLAYIIVGSSIATVGQTVTLDGRPSVLVPPVAVFAQVPTTVDDVATTTGVYIISGSLTASIGQSITLDGTPTVLAAPDLVPSLLETTSNGVVESRFVYVLRTSSIATIGQTVILDGKTTVLSEPTEAMVAEGGAAVGWDTSRNAALIGLCAIFVVML